jgi:hypothetical protein
MAGDKETGKGGTGRNGDKETGKGVTGRNGDKETGKGEGSGFGGGGGWVVVAFISPVGMDVPGLAARILRGERSQPSSGSPRRKALGSAILGAQKAARAQQIQLRDQELRQAKLRNEYEQLRQVAQLNPPRSQ